jgi:hypothetical protein
LPSDGVVSYSLPGQQYDLGTGRNLLRRFTGSHHLMQTSSLIGIDVETSCWFEHGDNLTERRLL